MTVRFATPDEIINWNALVSKSGYASTVFSTSEYGRIKKLTGYTPRYIIADDLAVLALEKNVPPLGKLWYLPKGPNIKSLSELTSVMDSLKVFAKTKSVFTIKVESELPLTDSSKIGRAHV